MATVIEALRLDVNRALRGVEEAKETAKTAANRSLDVYEALGKVARGQTETASKVDFLISAQRETKAQLKKQTEAFLELAAAVKTFRPALQSFHDLEGEVDELTKKERRRKKRHDAWMKWGKRATVAFIVGAATVLGGAFAVHALQSCGLHDPSTLQVKP